MSIISEERRAEIYENYVPWANSLDSAGKDSGPAIERIDRKVLELIDDNFKQIVRLGEKTDKLKKWIFYGKTHPHGLGMSYGMIEYDADRLKENLLTHESVRILHAIQGLMTETAELAQMFHQSLLDPENYPFDWTNFCEEVGDLFWYLALLATAEGYGSFLPYLVANKAKLVARYGDTWTQEGALNRDTENEMKELEGSLEEDQAPFPPSDIPGNIY